MRMALELLLVGVAKDIKLHGVTAVPFGQVVVGIGRRVLPRHPAGGGRKALRTCASPSKFFSVRTSDVLRIKTHK